MEQAQGKEDQPAFFVSGIEKMKKNAIYEVTIEDMSADGDGIGHILEASEATSSQDGKEADKRKGFTVFVKDTVVGDVASIRIIKQKRNYAYGRLEALLHPSPYRVPAPCQKARSCGGCTLMHISYEKQLEYKQTFVKNCLERIGGIKDAERWMEPILGMDQPFHYRNKMQFPVGLDKEGKVQIGFYAKRTHSIIDLEQCAIGHPIHTYLIPKLRQWLQDWQDRTHTFIYNEQNQTGLIRHILTRVGFATGELMVCLVVNSDGLPDDHRSSGRTGYTKKQAASDCVTACEAQLRQSILRAVEAFNQELDGNMLPADGPKWKKLSLESLCLNINKEHTNRILGDRCKTLWKQPFISDRIGDIELHISPMSFYQVNPIQMKGLYDKAVEYADLKGEEVVWDLYCGIGTISLSMAKRAKKVYGVEIVPQAVEDARKNAKLNGINNTEFICGKAEEVVPDYYQNGEQAGRHPDVVVVDPPRKGCEEELLRTIADMRPDRIVYVSCDPATLARDIKQLCASGYALKRVGAVDQFCHSGHVETVVLLTKVHN